MHNVVLVDAFPGSALPKPYVGFDKDGLYLGNVLTTTGGNHYQSYPLNEEQLKEIILFATVALKIKQLKPHYDERVDWTRLKIWHMSDYQFIIMAVNVGSEFTTDTMSDCVVIHTENTKGIEGAQRRFDNHSLKDWIHPHAMDPMKYMSDEEATAE